MEKNKHAVFARKVSNAQEKVRGMLKAEFMKWIFRFAIIKLRLQLRYLAYEQQFKTFKQYSPWYQFFKQVLCWCESFTP